MTDITVLCFFFSSSFLDRRLRGQFDTLRGGVYFAPFSIAKGVGGVEWNDGK
jgi:hypothetical protein